MAKNSHKEEQELPFVALMDTLTNVVGVLTIVLVMMGISLARAASRVLCALPPATVQQIREAQAKLDRLHADQDSRRVDLEESKRVELTPENFAALDAELARLAQEVKAANAKPVNIDQLHQEKSKCEQELAKEKAAIDQLMADRDRLKALLDDTPVTQAPPAKVVRIPASRPIPEGAKIEHVLVTKDGVYWLNITGAKAALLNTLKLPSNRNLVNSVVKRNNKAVLIFDYQKMRSHFEKDPLTYRKLRMDVVWADWSTNPLLCLRPTGPSSNSFQATAERLKSAPKTVVMFHVTGDGYENYITARKECDAAGMPAGWEFSGGPEYTVHVPEVETNKPPPPPAPPAPAQPSTTKEIKPPPPKLD